MLLRHRLNRKAESRADERDYLVPLGLRQLDVSRRSLSPKIEEMGCSSKASAKQALGHEPSSGLDVLMRVIRKSSEQPPAGRLWSRALRDMY